MNASGDRAERSAHQTDKTFSVGDCQDPPKKWLRATSRTMKTA